MNTRLFTVALLLCTPLMPHASEEQHYKRGDCVTATDPDYSWFGEVAKVEAYSEIDGMPRGKHYILTFPTYKSNDAIFGVEIEEHTTVVDKKHCDRSEYK